ncbi:flagellar assembly protein FliH [Pseudomonas sp. S60]|uniref:flagellar assembly protein FliH n=1 Tax=unclassified Pseudomonas TaxID=196821 RepID=UPI0019148A4B|nr:MULTISPECIES: flagellar assembly protein FliH [unclassified Pseudomonas]MBK5005148.1 flagellar assembly protein FliH [Pseudomonas sp. S32]MBK5011454.1 flagellar assembly protein FliH [Pseudomonas sp. S60]
MSTKEHHPSDLIRARDLEGVDVWALPSFDPQPPPRSEPEQPVEVEEEVEEVPLEDVQPLTLEELEAIRQEAYNEGFATGEREGFHSTQLKVRQEADEALKVKLASLERLMTHLMEPIAEQDTHIEKTLVHLVAHITRQVIGRELHNDSSQITQVLRGALKLLPMGADNIRIHLNPQDFELAKALRERHEENWRLLEDSTLLPGGCRIETAQSRIDATMETRIEKAVAQLFDQLHDHSLHPAAADLSVDLDAPAEPADAP